MNTVVIGLGSNICAQKNIKRARVLLSKKFHVLRESRFVPTHPIGMAGQDFVNGAVLAETILDLPSLKKTLQRMESQLGRPRKHAKDESRTMDLDILVFNDQVITEDVHNRDFVRQSVFELVPELLKNGGLRD